MMTDFNEFEKRLRFFANKIGKAGNVITKKAAKVTLETLANTTPVDEGHAVSNWQVGLGRTPTGVRQPFVLGELGSTRSANVSEVVSNGLLVINRYKSGNTGAIHIVNNAKHIKALNDGHSKQAPANFIEMAVVSAKEVIKGFRISYR